MLIAREKLEEKQIGIYIITSTVSTFVWLYWNNIHILEEVIEPTIGLLLYSMFCQIPFLELKPVLKNHSFFKALLMRNFVLVPLLVWILTSVFPTTATRTLGIILALLTPCVDYVIVFTGLGKGNSKAVLASSPMLFISQMLLLPLYLWIFLGKQTLNIIEAVPLVKAFLYLIVIPFLFSIITQMASRSDSKMGKAVLDFLGWLPVPFMALTFFIIIASQIDVLYNNPEPIIKVAPIYVAFAITAPFIGKLSAKLFKVDVYSSRAVSFSTGTRNCLGGIALISSRKSGDRCCNRDTNRRRDIL